MRSEELVVLLSKLCHEIIVGLRIVSVITSVSLLFPYDTRVQLVSMCSVDSCVRETPLCKSNNPKYYTVRYV